MNPNELSKLLGSEHAAVLADLKETADRLQGLARKLYEGEAVNSLDVLLTAKAAGYLRGMANFVDEAVGGAEAAMPKTENLTILDT